MKLKLLFLTLIILLSGGILQAMDHKKSKIQIEFYDKKTKNDYLITDKGCIGAINFDTYGDNFAHVGVIQIRQEYMKLGYMKLFMAYFITYIYRNYPYIDMIMWDSQSLNSEIMQNTLDAIYLRTGAVRYKKSQTFTFDLKKFKGGFLDFSQIPLEKNSQIFKNIYVKIIDKNTGKQINLEEKPKNNSEENNQIQSKL